MVNRRNKAYDRERTRIALLRNAMKNPSGGKERHSPSQGEERGAGSKKGLTPLDIHRLMLEDRPVPRSISTDPEIFKQEIKRSGQESWLLVAHESEIPNPGDYKALSLAQQPVIVVRDDGGQIHVLFNICRHRAVTVCREGKGNTRYFQCMYHGWMYNTKGHLVGVNGADRYGERFRKETKGLVPLPRVDRYRGFIFASLSSTGERLNEYLEKAKFYI
jgi:phenylpropionate dioxygenase-like ring-hydroxylating dioxygenase large terminal subunit